jgi:hypothetical protein
MKKERPMSVVDAAKNSLIRPERKQMLSKEVVVVRSTNEAERRMLDAVRKVAAGESLYLMDRVRPEKPRG